MRLEKLFLVDIKEAAEAIQRFIEPISKDEFWVMNSARVVCYKN
jgi:hypothetical protein